MIAAGAVLGAKRFIVSALCRAFNGNPRLYLILNGAH
jgi:hypothetical protein